MSARTSSWVSKTDLTRYLRCPYAFYLLDRGLVAFEDTVTDLQARLVEQGIEFQAEVEARAAALPIKAADLPKVFAQESIRLFGLPAFENAKLRIYGKPDAIDTAKGALIPVEVKSHKAVQRADELELAFYWMLLDPHRTKKVSPRGYLLLRRDGVDEQVDVVIRPHRLEQVHGLLREIREARNRGVPPRICGCTVCTRVMHDEIDRATVAKKDLTRIWGIGRVYARHLEEMGITNYEGLVTVDSAFVVENLRKQKCFVSPAQIDCWKRHAASYSSSIPVLFGDPLRLDGQFIALDLEYVPGGILWLVGICLVGPSGCEYFALWADTPAEGTMRFPIPQMGLGHVASYFAIPRVSRIRDGLEALSLYQEYRLSQDEDRRIAIKANLVEYNRDDLEALVGVVQRIACLQCSGQLSPALTGRADNSSVATELPK